MALNEEPASERRFLGVVEVDTGTLVLGDPASCLPHAERGKPGIDYAAVIGAPVQTASYLDGQPVILLGGFGGDGAFPVYAEFDETGVVRVVIEFVGPDDDGTTMGSRAKTVSSGSSAESDDSVVVPPRLRSVWTPATRFGPPARALR
jgi:hypothetical protein